VRTCVGEAGGEGACLNGRPAASMVGRVAHVACGGGAPGRSREQGVCFFNCPDRKFPFLVCDGGRRISHARCLDVSINKTSFIAKIFFCSRALVISFF
jgi:hypothetical protein